MIRSPGILDLLFPTSNSKSEETGIAVLIALLALSLFSLLGLYMSLNATTDLRISDNYESQVQATYAALAGLNHARALLRGLDFDDLLRGPDGTHIRSNSYVAQAKTFGFRNLVPWTLARSLDIINPGIQVSGIPDDGLINSGSYSGTNGTVLIPLTGIALTAPQFTGSGMAITSRYLVKVTDNNGEASELAADAADNPFLDGDGIVILRSMGIARTIPEVIGTLPQQNSVIVFEARFKQMSTFNLGSPLLVQGSQVNATFSGQTFNISGGLFPGIATIDPNSGDGISPDQLIRAAVGGIGSITGGGISHPSILDITNRIISNPDQLLLLNPGYLWDFVQNKVPRFADYVFIGNQHWRGGSAPYLGSYNINKARSAPGQDPKITLVNGNLDISGNVTGAGLLIVTGNLSCSGSFAYHGLLLAIGFGNVSADGLSPGVTGGLYMATLNNNAGSISFGMPTLSLAGSSRFTVNSQVMDMAVGLIPASQIGFREITSSLDP